MAKEISQELFDELKLKGYKGEATLEDMMIPLNEKHIKDGTKYINGVIWWVIEKDKLANVGKDFVNIVSDKLGKEILKGGK